MDDLNGFSGQIGGFCAVVLLVIVMIAAGVGWHQYEALLCQERAEAMQVNWMYDRGCYIQQPNGTWTQLLDNPNGYLLR